MRLKFDIFWFIWKILWFTTNNILRKILIEKKFVCLSDIIFFWRIEILTVFFFVYPDFKRNILIFVIFIGPPRIIFWWLCLISLLIGRIKIYVFVSRSNRVIHTVAKNIKCTYLFFKLFSWPNFSSQNFLTFLTLYTTLFLWRFWGVRV
jgi:hypothetical protein